MYIIEVIPLTLLPFNVPQILTYFYSSKLSKGAVVEILLNKRKVKAVVISSNSIEKEKLALKRVDFQIKKIAEVTCEKPQVNDYQLRLAAWLAKYYCAPLGYTLKTILPPFAFKKKYSVVIHNFPLPTRRVGNPQVWIYKTKELVKYLEPLVEKVTKTEQILIIVPEKSSINYFSDFFSKKYNTTVVYSDLSNEKLYDAWQKAQSGETKIIVGTRQALNMHFKNLGLIIVEDPLHEFYKSDMMPRYNAVTLAYKVAELNNSRLIFTSVIPGVENYYKAKNGIYELKSIESRPEFDTEIIDMTQEVRNANWSPISKKLNEELLFHLKNGKKILVFSPRRGYAGILMCGNCGSAVKCPRCDVAMRTHRSVDIILVCHRCGTSKPMPANCSVCGNHNLRTAGPVGTQKIYEEIKTKLASKGIKSPVLVLDSDVVKNETEEEEEVISEISKPQPTDRASVLIATQMIFSHRLYLDFDLIAIINADTLMNMPDFRSEENLFYQMEKLVCFEPKKLLIQTYNPENKLVGKAVAGDYADFYDNELKFREALNYPPFFKLIKLTFRHKNNFKASFAARVITEKLKMAIARSGLPGGGEESVKIIEAMPAYIEKEKGLYVYNIFLKIREDYQNINDLLKYVGSGWIIDIEPRSLL